MEKPIQDEVFGSLEWDPLLNCWLGGIDWPRELHTEVAIWIPVGDLSAGLFRAHQSLDWLKLHEEEAHRVVAKAALRIYNDAWRDEDEPMSEVEFIHRTELGIAFKDDESLLLSYGAGEMFGGHVLDGLFDPNRSFRSVDLVG